MFEYWPFTLYQSLSLFLNGITSLLLVYFGLHQYSINLKKNNPGTIILKRIEIADPDFDHGIEELEEFPIPSISVVENRGPGTLSEISLNYIRIATEDDWHLINFGNWGESNSNKEKWPPKEERTFGTETKIKKEIYEKLSKLDSCYIQFGVTTPAGVKHKYYKADIDSTTYENNITLITKEYTNPRENSKRLRALIATYL